MPDYETFDPRGWCGDPKRGAALGRPTIDDGPPEGVIFIRQVHLDSGGYDPNGTYFGVGEPLFWYADEGENIDGVLRAFGPDQALREVEKKFPGAELRLGADLYGTCEGVGEDLCGAPLSDENPYQCEDCLMREMEEEDA